MEVSSPYSFLFLCLLVKCLHVVYGGVEPIAPYYYVPPPPPPPPIVHKTVIQEPPKVFIHEVPVKVFVRVCPDGNCDGETATESPVDDGSNMYNDPPIPLPPRPFPPPQPFPPPIRGPPITPATSPPIIEIPSSIINTHHKDFAPAPCSDYNINSTDLCKLIPKNETGNVTTIEKKEVKYRAVYKVIDRHAATDKTPYDYNYYNPQPQPYNNGKSSYSIVNSIASEVQLDSNGQVPNVQQTVPQNSNNGIHNVNRVIYAQIPTTNRPEVQHQK